MHSSRTHSIPDLELVAVDLEGFTIHEPSGDRAGYRIKFELAHPAGAWTEWMFITEAGLEGLVPWLKHKMETEGHLSRTNVPSGPLQ